MTAPALELADIFCIHSPSLPNPDNEFYAGSERRRKKEASGLVGLKCDAHRAGALKNFSGLHH